MSTGEDITLLTVWKTYFNVVRTIREYIEELDNNVTALRNSLAAIGQVQTKRKHLKSAKIIGMTTTGAVKYKDMILKSFKPRVMLVEEAAHVLEGHVVASLTEHCDQLIMIGDHKQLRPLTADNSLSWRYKLDVSLMERLVRNGLDQGIRNWDQLKIQHRMRPEIARMVCPLIYKELYNHPDVLKYEKVKGCRKNLYFIDHQFPDGKEVGSASYHNMYEISVVKALANFFLDNGYYSPSRITIIAAYKAQRDLIENQFKESINSDLANIRVSTVDGYQGEENDIVILSLVRSNREEMIGFLKTNNRLCVALSRARHGFFITGNMTCLSGGAENWATLFGTLKEMDAFGSAGDLPLYGRNENILKTLKQPPIPKVRSKISCPVEDLNFQLDKLSMEDAYSYDPVLSNGTLLPPQDDLRQSKPQLPSLKVTLKPISTSVEKVKCDHKIPHDTCKVQVRVIKHSICGHKVVVRCCDQGKESTVWCSKDALQVCHSCNFVEENKVLKCRDILKGKKHCKMCKKKLQHPNQITKQIQKVEQVKPTVSTLVGPIKTLHPPSENRHQSKAKLLSTQAPGSLQLKTTPTSSAKVKCNHRIPQDDCKVVIRTIKHSICKHKVVVRCCDQGKESTLWCGKYAKLACYSCKWVIPNKNVTCRSILMGNYRCLQCNTIIKSEKEYQSSAPTQEAQQIMPQAEILTPMPSPAKVKPPKKQHECAKIFKCGHRCRFGAGIEHSQLHSNYKCLAQCKRTCPKGHSCSILHKCSTFCALTAGTIVCNQTYDYVFKCGHLTGTTLKCAEVSKKRLKKLLVDKLCDRCDH